MILVVVILWLLFAMTRSFFNVWRQKKVVFWETCLNYVFGEIDKFQTDIKYGKLPVTVSWMNGVYRIRLFGENQWWYANSSGFAWLIFDGAWDDYSTVKNYNYISLSSKNYSTFNNESIPPQCYHNEYTLVAKPSIWSREMMIAIPTVKTNSSKWYIWDDRETNSSPQITWEVIYSVCWLPDWQTNPVWANLPKTTACIEIGKVHIDIRSETINFLKCAKTNDTTWICGLWPRLN